MACFALPVPPIPTLPSGITIPVPPLPPIPTLVLPCCNFPIPPFPIVLPAIAITIVLDPAILLALQGYMRAFQAYVDQFQISCPLQ